MRLDGAVGPHHGAPATGSSPGARKYRAKRCAAVTSTAATTAAHCDDEDAEAGVKTLENISNTSSNNNNSSSSSNSLESSRRGASPQHLQQKNQQRSITTSRPKKLENVSQYGSTQAEALETHRKQLCTSLNATPKITKGLISVIAAKMLRVQQSLMAAAGIGSGSGGGGLRSALQMSTLLVLSVLSVIALLPNGVYADDSDNFFAVNSFSMSPETTTPEFDYASRGPKKFGDKCDNTLECGFPGSICDPKKKSCQCTEDLPVTNHIDKCGKEASVNESCFFNEQCEMRYFQTECRDGKCVCRFEMLPIWNKDGTVECAGRGDKKVETYIDPAMIGVLVGMALMFVIICVVLRLFSQARWHENRTIFNTPNPRLMNVSLLRESKLLHGQERRGSRMSVRAPSRQPSMASLRPHSPNPSLGKTGNDSHGSGSNASATSLRSTRSNSVAPGNVVNHERKGSAHHNQQQHHHHQQQQQQQQPLITNITPNPNPDQVTVEIIEPEK